MRGAREHCRERAAGLRFTKPSLENCTAPQYKKNMYKNVDSMARHAVAPGAGWLARLGTYTGCIIGCGRYVDTSTTCASAHSRTSRQPKDCSTPPIRNAVSAMVQTRSSRRLPVSHSHRIVTLLPLFLFSFRKCFGYACAAARICPH